MIAAEPRRRPLSEVLGGAVQRMAREVGELASTVEESLAVNGRRVQLPQWLFIFLIGQFSAGVWWAATMSSDVKYLQLENAKLWSTNEDLKSDMKELNDSMDDRVKAKVREQLLDGGWVRVRDKGGD